MVANQLTAGQPIFTLDLCDLFDANWTRVIYAGQTATRGTTIDGGCGSIDLEARLWDRPYYVCPKEDSPTNCRGEPYFFCGLWGECLTASPGRDGDKHLKVTRVIRPGGPTEPGTCYIGDCNPVEVTVKTWNETDSWMRGRMWGIKIPFSEKDFGTLFTIQLRMLPWTQNPIGPLRPVILGEDPRPTLSPSLRMGEENETNGDQTDIAPSGTKLTDTEPLHPRVKPLVKTVELMYYLLNESDPNITRNCWLCLHPEPPYYIGVAASAGIGSQKGDIRKLALSSSNSKGPECKWGVQPHMTLGDIQGRGTCIITANYKLESSPYRGNCNLTIKVSKTQEWATLLKAPEGTWWACTSGMTPCITPYGMTKEDLCVLAHILPHVYYSHGEEGWAHLERQGTDYLGPIRRKRVPIVVPILVGTAIAGTVAMGAAALAKETTLVQLDQQINQDMATLEGTIESLEGSLSSLAEVVLQNRRGLDLLFMKQGRLCVALNEACCFYANHSGMVKKTLSEVKKRIEDRDNRLRDLSEDSCFHKVLSKFDMLALGSVIYVYEGRTTSCLQLSCFHYDCPVRKVADKKDFAFCGGPMEKNLAIQISQLLKRIG
ncbi:endogenous retrovirus group S71 member 1 Env polyprotein-like [Erinaceus europaeus]|uniref:Endogenous retrovirus group S71 member 1 Env polyprotein-like n=1 Tax=Erinaceus europaeus TaxID=9365 RepID=A0ABM3XWA2_ERIEU|nr:endogenous retrovirus group S71 member 1 Env polyprotein-like [Erinaceus europaeus]